MQVLVEKYNAIKINAPSTLETLDKKLDHMATMISKGVVKPNGVGSAFLVLFFGPSIALLILRLTRGGISSFLVFSKGSENDRKKKLKKEKRRYLVVAVSYILATLGSIIANFGYAWLVS
jgi:hypothetical protein